MFVLSDYTLIINKNLNGRLKFEPLKTSLKRADAAGAGDVRACYRKVSQTVGRHLLFLGRGIARSGHDDERLLR